jgi:exonuclease SbcC
LKLLALRARGLRSFAREIEVDLARLGEEGLFAIVGPTGAGKSTVLDGIFLALFGKCPRGEPADCVSLGARELFTRVELEDNGRTLAVERVFRWTKPPRTATAEGETRAATKHAPLRIEEKIEGAWQPLELGGARAEDVLRDRVVRVSMSDFQQAVVLPQGEFDALLRAKPADRRTLVASLFRTEHLGAPLVEVLRTRENAVRTEIGQLEQAHKEIAVTDEELVRVSMDAEDARAGATKLDEELAQKTKRATELVRAREQCAARDRADEAARAAQARVTARQGDRVRLELARRAEIARPALEERQSALAALTEAEERVAAAEPRLLLAKEALRTAKIAQRAAQDQSAERLPDVLERLGRARLAAARDQEQPELDRLREVASKAYDAAAAEVDAKNHVIAVADEAIAQATNEEGAVAVKLARATVTEHERAEARLTIAVAEARAARERAEATRLRELALADEALETAEKTRATAAAATRAAEVIAEEARAVARRAALDAKRSSDEVERAEIAFADAQQRHAAAVLAERLMPGSACPVCGAREHPGVDHGSASTSLRGLEAGVAAAKRHAIEAELRRAETEVAKTAREEDVRARETDLEKAELIAEERRTARERLARGDDAPISVREADDDVARRSARVTLETAGLDAARIEVIRAAAERMSVDDAQAMLRALVDRAREGEALAERLARLREEAARRTAARSAAVATLGQAERDRAAAAMKLAEARSRASSRRDEVNVLLATLAPGEGRKRSTPSPQLTLLPLAKAPPDAPRLSPQAWIERLDGERAELVARETEAHAALDRAREEDALAALEAREARARASEATGRAARANKEANLAMHAAKFDDLESLERAAMPSDERERLAAALTALDDELARLVAIALERRRDVTIEVTEEAAIAAVSARDEARLAAERARERAAELATKRAELTRRKARAAELESAIRALAPRAERLQRVRLVVMSNQLAELAAERHLEAVTTRAAELLGGLSRGRYALVRTDAGAFAVADAHHGGVVRVPSTLSGGETFLVSLALALALSERIQLAGRTRFDFFFLDEGFGSLDPSTLESALSALEELRGPDRVIGMISHVAALEERMPRRLRIVPTRSGTSTLEHEPPIPSRVTTA